MKSGDKNVDSFKIDFEWWNASTYHVRDNVSAKKEKNLQIFYIITDNR